MAFCGLFEVYDTIAVLRIWVITLVIIVAPTVHSTKLRWILMGGLLEKTLIRKGSLFQLPCQSSWGGGSAVVELGSVVSQETCTGMSLCCLLLSCSSPDPAPGITRSIEVRASVRHLGPHSGRHDRMPKMIEQGPWAHCMSTTLAPDAF